MAASQTMVATISHTSETHGLQPGGHEASPGRRLALVLEYDGAGYAGFQLQVGQPTIQGEIEKALTRFTGRIIRIRGASRTDSGAHAVGQVVDFLTHSRHPVEVFPKALNFYLPQDIKVQAAYSVPQNFHSRLQATSRTYRYQVLNRPWPSALRRNRWFWVDGDLNVAKMASAAQSLVGWHDFRGLAPGYPAEKNSDRLVFRWDVWREDEVVIFECEANGFLKHQIRRANGLLLEVGKDRRPTSVVGEVLAGARSGDIEWPSIPAYGLCLMKVMYPDFPPPPETVAGEAALASGVGPVLEKT